jgi:hypothetical protein
MQLLDVDSDPSVRRRVIADQENLQASQPSQRHRPDYSRISAAIALAIASLSALPPEASGWQRCPRHSGSRIGFAGSLGRLRPARPSRSKMDATRRRRRGMPALDVPASCAPIPDGAGASSVTLRMAQYVEPGGAMTQCWSRPGQGLARLQALGLRPGRGWAGSRRASRERSLNQFSTVLSDSVTRQGLKLKSAP